jgi:pilus assembly protein CpaE
VRKHFVLVGGRDRAIEELLQSPDAAVTRMPLQELTKLSPADRHPDGVVVVDLRGETAVPTAVATLRRNHPDVPVMLVLSRLEPALMLEAMRAGVSEVVADPLDRVEVSAALERMAAAAASLTTGVAFGFVGAKGGVGATTTAVNVATEFRLATRESTLLIDLHLAYGDAALYLGADPRFSVGDVLENPHRLDEAFLKSVVTKTKSGIDLLASPDRQVTGGIDAPRVQQLLEFASRHYRYIVLDLPRSEPAILDALDSVTRLVVVANQELPTVRAAARMLASLQMRYGRDRVTVAVSRFDSEAGIGHDDIERALGCSIKYVVPSDYRLALEALNSGRPLTLGNHNVLSSSYKALARDLAGIEGQAAGASPGLFGRLLGRRPNPGDRK